MHSPSAVSQKVNAAPHSERTELPKAATGIDGLDEITGGGIPRGRPTLVCGGAGCGKSLLAMEFLVRGATEYDEPGVFISFEEPEVDLVSNVRSLGFDLKGLIEQNLFAIDHVQVERSEIEEAGEYSLDGLFVRIGLAIDSIAAKRVVLDTIESLFAGFDNPAILRAELRRLFHWLKDRGVTAIITAEKGEGQLTRQGLEEYVSDCVILLDHRVTDQVSTRRLRVVKYRGSTHGTNEYPFLIDDDGISVLPITSLALAHTASTERVSSGVARLDAMLDGGYYRGSSILISGTAGTGKTSLAAHLADATCRRGERCLYFSFEESAAQIIRNMRSIGLDLQPWMDRGLLQFLSTRPSMYGLEMHLATMHKRIDQLDPQTIIVDPISSFVNSASPADTHAMLVRLIDYLKVNGKTALMTALTSGASAWEQTDIGVSSIVDTWLLVRDIEVGGERNRGLYILKSRGMAHSNQIREFLLTRNGIELLDVYVGPEGVLTGSMRLAQEARERSERQKRERDLERERRLSDRRRQALEAQIAALQAELAAGATDDTVSADQAEETAKQSVADEQAMARRRRADGSHVPR
jgi:circadian clock protein KaiC